MAQSAKKRIKFTSKPKSKSSSAKQAARIKSNNQILNKLK
jgi:hypothetical protein